VGYRINKASAEVLWLKLFELQLRECGIPCHVLRGIEIPHRCL